jgi:hypothetical protein
MKRIAIINGGRYTPFICEALNPKHYEITEWEVIPLVGDYHLVFLFLEGLIFDKDIPTIRSIKKRFLDYVKKYPCKWVIFAPQDNKFIRQRGIMKNHNRCILDGCRFGFRFKKRFRCWSSFPITSVLCNRNCVMARASLLHDPKYWPSRENEPMVKRQIDLFRAYDSINVIPIDLVKHVVELSLTQENKFVETENEDADRNDRQ